MEPITLALGVAKLFGLDKKIGSLFGGDRGAEIAEQVVDVVRRGIGSDKLSDIEATLAQNPELAAQLHKQINDIAARETELIFADISNARAMQVAALEQDDLFSKRFLYYFASAWSVFAMLYMICVTFIDIPKDNVRFADSMQTFILSTVVATIIYFFFGSSRSSHKKDDVISSLRDGK